MNEQLEEKLDINQFITPKDQLGYAEEYIIFKNENIDGELLNYSLSNKLDDIEIAIFNRTGQVVKLKNAYWEINPNLSVIVKQLMNKHNVKYSMTIRQEKYKNKEYKIIYVNMRSDDIWLTTVLDQYKGKFYFWDKVRLYQAIDELMEEYFPNEEDK